MHILDTDTLTHLHAGHQNVVQHLQALSDADVGATLITKIELLRGRFEYVLKASAGGEALGIEGSGVGRGVDYRAGGF